MVYTLGVNVYTYLLVYGVMIIKLIMAIVAAVIFMHIFGSTSNLKQMTPLSVIINFLLSAILSGFILNKSINILDFIVVVLIYGALITLLNLWSFYTNLGRRIFVGTPQVIIQDGQLDTEKMQKLKMSARDLASVLRQHKIHSLSEVEMAQIEPSGEMTIVKKGDKSYSIVLVDNGIIDTSALQKIHRSERWLRRELRAKKIRNIDDIFIAQWYRGKLYVVKKNVEPK